MAARNFARPAAALAMLVCTTALASPPAGLPEGWQLLRINDRKRLTAYELVQEDARPVLHARAESSASGLYKVPAFGLAERPVMTWRWKVSGLVPGADNSQSTREDAPARIVLAFAGDREKLPKSDQRTLRLARRLSGHDMPYATLMYIWASEAPVGSVIANPLTRRVQMVVASSGRAGVGAWQEISRNVVEDFRRAFKEEPGKLVAYGIMTDTDNIGGTVDAWYGEIEFRAP